MYLKPWSGKWDVNGRTLGDYFRRHAVVCDPAALHSHRTLGRFDLRARIEGGGVSGQQVPCVWPCSRAREAR